MTVSRHERTNAFKWRRDWSYKSTSPIGAIVCLAIGLALLMFVVVAPGLLLSWMIG